MLYLANRALHCDIELWYFAPVSRRRVHEIHTIFHHLLTYAADGEHSYRVIRRRTVREKRLEDVDAESQGDNGLAARAHYHALNPQSNKRQEGSEGLHDVRVIRPRFPNHTAKLGVAISPYLSTDTENMVN